jgi:hypothetical protein
MDASKTEERILRLERVVKVLAGMLVVTLALSGFGVVREIQYESSPPPKPPTEFRSGSVVVDETGFDARGKTADGRTAQALARADTHGAGFALGVGKVGMSLTADDASATVRVETQGAVESNLEVDTATGTWSIVQRRLDRKRNILKEQRTPLAPPLPQ